MAADMLKSMTEYDYFNGQTRNEDKKHIKGFLDIELSGKKQKPIEASDHKDAPDEVIDHKI